MSDQEVDPTSEEMPTAPEEATNGTPQRADEEQVSAVMEAKDDRPPLPPGLRPPSGIRRPSKIPRLGSKSSTNVVAASSSDGPGDPPPATTTTSDDLVEPPTAMNSQKSTPMHSPQRPPPSRLKGPGWFGRKRKREEDAMSAATSEVDENQLTDGRVSREEGDGDRSLRTVPAGENRLDGVHTDQEAVTGQQEEEHTAENKDENTEEAMEQKINVARCLQLDLLRDRARRRLLVDGLRTDIDYYYEVLARIEATTVDVMTRTTKHAEINSGSADDHVDGIIKLANRIQAIIGAERDIIVESVVIPSDETITTAVLEKTAEETEDRQQQHEEIEEH